MFLAKELGRFRAEFFVLEREAYIYTSSERTEKANKNLIKMEKTVGFQP